MFGKYPKIERVLVFGSRAKGLEKPYSEIDLAVIAPGMGDTEFARVLNDLDELELVFKLDVLHLDRLNQPKLREGSWHTAKTSIRCDLESSNGKFKLSPPIRSPPIADPRKAEGAKLPKLLTWPLILMGNWVRKGWHHKRKN